LIAPSPSPNQLPFPFFADSRRLSVVGLALALVFSKGASALDFEWIKEHCEGR